MRKILLIFVGCCCILQSNAQASFSIQGWITSTTGEPLRGASVNVLNSSLNAIADSNGVFEITNIRIGKYQLEVSCIGYSNSLINIMLSRSHKELDIKLDPIGKQLAEITVTAQKREESLQDVPLSISAFNDQDIKNYRLLNPKELTAFVPNLYSANPGDNRNITSIRGIATTSYDQAIATYIDGVSQFGLDTYIAQLQDIERIEVLRGPQGTLYGRNAMGGVINIITKQPSNNFSGFAEAGRGNYGQQRYNLGFRAPLVNNRLYFGAVGLFNTFNGFYSNQFNASHFDKQHSFSGNYFLKYVTNSSLNFVLNVKHAANRNSGAFPLAGTVEEAFSQPYTVNQNAAANMVDNIFNASLSINHTGKHYNLNAQTAYQSNYRYYKQAIDADFSPLDFYAIKSDYGRKWNNVKVITQEVRLSSPASAAARLKWLTGLYAFRQFNPVRQGTFYGSDAGLIGLPNEAIGSTSLNTNIGTGYGLALFGQTNYSITSKLQVILGLRYDHEFRKITISGDLETANQSLINMVSEASSTARFNALSPKAGLQFTLNMQSMLYGTYTRGFRAGGISPLNSDPQSPPLYSYKPEYSNSFEIGSKYTFLHNRLRVNSAIFFTYVYNAQVPTLVLPEALTITRNAGKLSSRGIELELSYVVLPGLELNYTGGINNAHYTQLVIPANGQNADMSGNRQIFTPKATSALRFQYSHQLNKLTRLFGSGRWQYVGKQYFDLANRIVQDGGSLLNGQIGFSLKKLELSVWGANITGREYIDYAYDFGPAHLAEPRTYGVTIKNYF